MSNNYLGFPFVNFIPIITPNKFSKINQLPPRSPKALPPIQPRKIQQACTVSYKLKSSIKIIGSLSLSDQDGENKVSSENSQSSSCDGEMNDDFILIPDFF